MVHPCPFAQKWWVKVSTISHFQWCLIHVQPRTLQNSPESFTWPWSELRPLPERTCAMYMLNMVIILIVMYCNVITAIDKIPTYLLRFNNKPTSEFVGINVSIGIDDPWTAAELGGTVWVRLGTKSLASSIYFAGGHMVQAGWVDIAMGSTGPWKTAFYRVQHGESVNHESVLEQRGVSMMIWVWRFAYFLQSTAAWNHASQPDNNGNNWSDACEVWQLDQIFEHELELAWVECEYVRIVIACVILWSHVSQSTVEFVDLLVSLQLAS